MTWSDALQVGLAIGLITAWQNRSLTNILIGREGVEEARRRRRMRRDGVAPVRPRKPRKARPSKRKRRAPEEPTQPPVERKQEPRIFR